MKASLQGAFTKQEGPLMQSQNFEFLRAHRSILADLGGFAEQYAIPDPSGSLMKLRLLNETLVKDLYQELGLSKPYQDDVYNLLREDAFKQVVPAVIVNKMDTIRFHGNKAVHGQSIHKHQALHMLQEAFDVTRWTYLAFHQGKKEDCPPFIEPQNGQNKSLQELQREKKNLKSKLAEQESKVFQLLEELEEARQLKKTVEKTNAERQTLIEQSQGAVNVLDFNEETTRRYLIDTQLAAAGWEVGPNGQGTDEVSQEFEINHQSTPSGKGRADYVLWNDDDKPLAVIEVKKTAILPETGSQQAQEYADGLEQDYDQRPVIFFTNGMETFIWDDAQGYVPRKIYGFYSKDSLQYLHFQRKQKAARLSEVEHNQDIVDRLYQIRAVKEVVEDLEKKRRKTLVVQATGTGKTRTAIALCDVLIRANWVKRILFLCDRRELRKQAKETFQERLPGQPLTYVTSQTNKDRTHRIYLATYPAMMKCYENFDVGFFDLIIADESHRSIYNKYRGLLHYFDALQMGLTATPVRLIDRNTYDLFSCRDQDPTSHYSLDEAIEEEWLCPFEVKGFTTPFLREGIKYREMTEEQKRQLELQEEIPELIDYDPSKIDKEIFNKDTARVILENLMENGIKEATGSFPGKTILFARNHEHAVYLKRVFDELFPDHGANFCRVIDNKEPRREQFIDDFKGKGNRDIQIAISVDMLDTGIDVPEIVNLVFAKPVRSYVKFWQMIGRGTRKCENLFGPGQHKTVFRIFDHWGNFKFFDEDYKETEYLTSSASLLQQLFEARLELAETAVAQQSPEGFDTAVVLMLQDIADLASQKNILVREKWRQIHSVQREEVLKTFDAATKTRLRGDIAPMMKWRKIGKEQADIYRFDLLVVNLQTEWLRHSSRFEDYRGELKEKVSQLPITINEVRAKLDRIQQLQGKEFWENLSIATTEEMRLELRNLMKYLPKQLVPNLPPKEIDVAEDQSLIIAEDRAVYLRSMDLQAYRQRVRSALMTLLETNPTLKKIQQAQPVSEQDLAALCSMVLTQNPDVDLTLLREFYSETALSLDQLIRGIIGLDAEAVKRHFTDFVNRFNLNSQQNRFLNLLMNHITRYGFITLEKLYEEPFITLHSEGLDGVFADEAQLDELLDLLIQFNPPTIEKGTHDYGNTEKSN